jgi:hypothetical protein
VEKFVQQLSVPEAVPQIVRAKFERAQKLHLLAWIDFDMITAGELVAFTAIELALKDCYGSRVRKDKRGNYRLADLLRYVVEHDDLTDETFAMNRRCGAGTVVDLFTGQRRPSLADIRNDLAHGYPFDGFPWAGMLELVRDVIAHAYRGITPQSRPLAGC